MENKSNEKEIVHELILKIFNFLECDYLYSPNFLIKKSAIFIEYISVEYINKVKKRSIDISFTKGKLDGVIKYTFTLTIVRIPYVDSEDMISLDNYLISKNQFIKQSMVNEFTCQQAENTLKEMADILNSELLDVVNGSNWYETYYPRKD